MIREEDKEPDIAPFIFLVDSYKELSTCRTSGMSPGPIPFTAIVEYAKIYNVEDFDDFLYYIRIMDNIVLEKSNGEGSKESSNSSKGRGVSGHKKAR